MAIAHELTRRELVDQDDGSYLGTLLCACGWGSRVGPFSSKPLTDATMSAEWAFHRASGGTTPEE